MAEKRKRSPNWLPSEKILLIDLVEKHLHTIENKKTDGTTTKAKLAEWVKIADEYNSQTSHSSRSADTLKAQWENMKKAARKEHSNLRMLRIQTGGGTPNSKKEDPLNSRIVSLVSTSASNPCDGDGVVADEFLASDAVAEPQGSIEIEVEKIMESRGQHENSVTEQDWGDYAPELLRTSICELKVNDRENIVDKSRPSRRRHTHTTSSLALEKLQRTKTEAVELQKQIASEESQRAAALHKKDLEIKTEILRQEKIKTRILLLELKAKKKKIRRNCQCSLLDNDSNN